MAPLGFYAYINTGDTMIYVEKYGGSLLENYQDLEKIARQVKKQIDEFGDNDRLILILSALKGETRKLTKEIKELNDKVEPATLDSYLVLGELKSVALFKACLEKEKVKASVLNAFQLPILTDDSHTNAQISWLSTQHLREQMAQHKVIIIPGFQGVTKKMAFTTLGLGGSDLTTMAIYHALKKEKLKTVCHVYKDVIGVYNTDPCQNIDAVLIPKIKLSELCSLTKKNAIVFDYKASLYAHKHRLEFTIGRYKSSATKVYYDE